MLLILLNEYFSQRENRGFYEVVLCKIKFLVTNKKLILVKVKATFCAGNLIPDIFLEWPPELGVSFGLRHLHLDVCSVGVYIHVRYWSKFAWESMETLSVLAGPGSQGLFHHPSQKQGRGTAPAPGMGHLPGDKVELRLGQDRDLWVGWTWQGPWLGRAGLGGAGDQPCFGIAGAGADDPGGLKWGPGSWVICGGIPGELGRDRPIFALRTWTAFQPHEHLNYFLFFSRSPHSSHKEKMQNY